MDQNKQLPPLEQSIKYMAWNVKQMDVNLKRIADAVEMIVQRMGGMAEVAPVYERETRKNLPVYQQGDIPF